MINQTQGLSSFKVRASMSFRSDLHPSVLQNIQENNTQRPRRDMNAVFAKNDRPCNRSNFSSAVCPPDVPE